MSHLLNSAERGPLRRLLADTPIAELLNVADGFDAIGSQNAGQRLRTAAERLAATGGEIERKLGEYAVCHRVRPATAN